MATQGQQGPTINPLGHAILRLAECFPGGASAGRKGIYLEEIERRRIPPDVLAEAVNRLIASHDKTTLPSLAALLDRVAAVNRERAGNGLRHLGEPRRDLSEAGIARDLDAFRFWREKDCPPRSKPTSIGALVRAELQKRGLSAPPAPRAESDDPEVPF